MLIFFCVCSKILFSSALAHINHIRDVAGIDYVGEYRKRAAKKENEENRFCPIMKWTLSVVDERNFSLLISKISLFSRHAQVWALASMALTCKYSFGSFISVLCYDGRYGVNV